VLIASPERFEAREDYYTTLFHELAHSTGHTKRLARGLDEAPAPFGALSRLAQMQAEKVYRNANFVAELRRLIGQLREVAPARTIGLPGCEP